MIEQAIEMAALMLEADKSRGYCLEMICADFLEGAHLDNGDPEILLNSISTTRSSCPANSGRLSNCRHERSRKRLESREQIRAESYTRAQIYTHPSTNGRWRGMILR